MVRPRLPAGEALEKTMTVRIATGDLERLDAMAGRLGLKPMTLVRLAALRALERLERGESPGFLLAPEPDDMPHPFVTRGGRTTVKKLALKEIAKQKRKMRRTAAREQR